MKRRVYKEQKHHIKLTQGSIITNCVAEGFFNTKIWGVIITPRCDLARGGKVNTCTLFANDEYKGLVYQRGLQDLRI